MNGFVCVGQVAVVVACMLRLVKQRRRPGLAERVPADPGPVLARSTWGTAVINGWRFWFCVRVTVHTGGWMVRVMPAYGGGRLWLPRARTVVGPALPGRPFRMSERTMTSRNYDEYLTVVVLKGRLAGYG